jgi:hypothetical protein
MSFGPDVDHEISILTERMKTLCQDGPAADGSYTVKYGVIFKDDFLAGKLEALAGTMRSAKRKKIITFAGELLMQGVHDNVDVTLLPPK